LLAASVLTGCAGTKPFKHVARAGDAIVISAGWMHKFSRDQIAMTRTPPIESDINM